MLKEFRDFMLRGNVVALSVAFILGAAFNGVVTAFTEGILMALLAAVVGEPNFDELAFTLNGTPIRYGLFLTALVNFVLVGVALFAFVKLVEAGHRRPEEKKAEPPETDHDLLVQIRDALRRARPAE